jgi:hypothetical protein
MAIDKSFLGTTGGDPSKDYQELYTQDVSEHYQALITEDGETTRLELKEAIPKWGTGSLDIRNETSESFTAEVRIERRRDATVVFNETIEVPPKEVAESVSYNQLFGSHDVTVATSPKCCESWGMRPSSSTTKPNVTAPRTFSRKSRTVSRSRPPTNVIPSHPQESQNSLNSAVVVTNRGF